MLKENTKILDHEFIILGKLPPASPIRLMVFDETKRNKTIIHSSTKRNETKQIL